MSDSRIVINEVGPRDGLQSQSGHLDLAQRRRFVEALLGAGLRHIEIGSFVSPKAVPQMAGTGELARALSRPAGAQFSALVPNMKGYELAREAGVETVAVVVSATETMNQKNIRMSLDEALAVARSVIERGAAEGARVQAYLAVAFECPFEGAVDAGRVCEAGRGVARRRRRGTGDRRYHRGGEPRRRACHDGPAGGEHGSTPWPATFTIRARSGWPTSTPPSRAACVASTRPWAGWAGAPLRRARGATSPRRTWSCFASGLGFDTGIDMPALLAW
jgi:hydroxymethylglutaryl-CoA lyase